MDSQSLTKAAAAAILILAVGVFTAHSQSSDQSPRVLVDTSQGELEIWSSSAQWCSEDLTLIVRAKDPRYLDNTETDAQGRRGRLLLQKLLGGLRGMLRSDCPAAKSVTLNGFVDDVFLYRGYASRDNPAGDWVLIEMPVELVEAPQPPPAVQPVPLEAAAVAPPPRRAAVGECDALAGHPDDPKRAKGVPGVGDDDIKPGPALKACEEANAIEPGNPRLKFQLARALISYDKTGEGLELMMSAAEDGHGAAVAALGDITLYGLLDETPDPETAKELYRKAVKLGFKPAVALVAAIEANPKEDTSQQQIAEPQYHQPNTLALLLRGESLPGSGEAFFESLVYSTRAVAGIVHQCPERSITVGQNQIFNVVIRRSGGVVAFIGFSAVGGGAYAQLQQQGMDDGYALAMTAGCDSPKVFAVVKSVVETTK